MFYWCVTPFTVRGQIRSALNRKGQLGHGATSGYWPRLSDNLTCPWSCRLPLSVVARYTPPLLHWRCGSGLVRCRLCPWVRALLGRRWLWPLCEGRPAPTSCGAVSGGPATLAPRAGCGRRAPRPWAPAGIHNTLARHPQPRLAPYSGTGTRRPVIAG